MEQLYLGVGRAVITPEIGCALAGYGPGIYSDSIADDLTATVFWFRQSEVQTLMVSLTLCNLGNAVRDEIQTQIEERFGIPRGLCMLSCTHTHSGPNALNIQSESDYAYKDNVLIPRVLEAIAAAREAIRPVTMGSSYGESCIGINRRQLNPDNSVTLGQNPWGSVDTKMTVLSFRDENGKTYANIVHYGCHGTCAGHHRSISRDWSGIMVDRMEQRTGGITAFFNGTAGDTGPRLSNGMTTGKGDYRFVYEIGYTAAQDAIRIFKSIPFYKNVKLQAEDCTVTLPLLPMESLEEARTRCEAIGEAKTVAQRTEKKHYQRVIEAYENGTAPADSYTVPQTVVRIGDTAIYSLPFEVFSGIGLRINGYSPIPNVLCFSQTNGSESYLPTQDQICFGGYEVNMFRSGHLQIFPDHADWLVISAALENLKRVEEETDA